MYTIYAIYNAIANKYYIGQTKDLQKRLYLHNTKALSGYTARFDGKWSLIYSEKTTTRAEALHREKQLKSYRGRQFIKEYMPKH